jgi:hypothetical protein
LDIKAADFPAKGGDLPPDFRAGLGDFEYRGIIGLDRPGIVKQLPTEGRTTTAGFGHPRGDLVALNVQPRGELVPLFDTGRDFGGNLVGLNFQLCPGFYKLTWDL